MKEAFVTADLNVHILDMPIPPLTSPHQILIKVIVSGSNPKDWKVPTMYPKLANLPGSNTGDDIAGIVEKVGSSVFEFKPGDRVAAFHEMLAPGGSFAEYAIAYQHTTFHLPPETSFEEAATLPLAAMTAAIGLYRELGLPEPWGKASSSEVGEKRIPLVIYGASSSVGFYALQFALRSGIHPLLCVAGRAASDYIAPMLDASKGDMVVDYREGDEKLVEALSGAAVGSDGKRVAILHAFDAVSEGGSSANIARVFARNPKEGGEGVVVKPRVTFVLPWGDKEGIDGSVESSITMVGRAHTDAKDFAYVYFRYIARGLQEGWFKGQRVEVVPGGLGGIEIVMRNLKEGKASGLKYVVRIGETEGVET